MRCTTTLAGLLLLQCDSAILSAAVTQGKPAASGWQQQPTIERKNQQSRTTTNASLLHHLRNDFPVKRLKDYMIVKRLGTGKFSDVFEAVDANLERSLNQQSSAALDLRSVVVVKCLKPVSERKVRRELAVLQHVRELPNLARLLGIVIPPEYSSSSTASTDMPRMPSLVLAHAGPHSQWLCHPRYYSSVDTTVEKEFLSDYEIRYYLYHLLIALEALHSHGIMHRDVKPRNVLINPKGRSTHLPLMLIDLGLADFYEPGQRYNVRVASRHYKSPELLVGFEYYDYALDLWAFGCILAGLLLRREPFFRGKDNHDQLAKIVAVLGTNDLQAYLQRYGIASHDVNAMLPSAPAQRIRDWRSFLGGGQPNAMMTDEMLPPRDGLDLLDKLLVYDHATRLTAKQAMQHAFFDRVRNRVQAEVLSYRTHQQHLCENTH